MLAPGIMARSAVLLPTTRILPPCGRCRAAALAATNTPRTLMASILSKSSRLNVSTGPKMRMPALFTSTSSPPRVCAPSSIALSSAAASALSACRARLLAHLGEVDEDALDGCQRRGACAQLPREGGDAVGVVGAQRGEEEASLVAERVVEALPADTHGADEIIGGSAGEALLPEDRDGTAEGLLAVEFLGTGHGRKISVLDYGVQNKSEATSR